MATGPLSKTSRVASSEKHEQAVGAAVGPGVLPGVELGLQAETVEGQFPVAVVGTLKEVVQVLLDNAALSIQHL